MKNLGTVVSAVILAVVLLLYMCTFQVRFTEVAIVKTWGEPAEEAIVNPGLYFKWPRPIQTTVVYDKRVRIMEDRTEETRTVDGKNVILTTYTLWRIADPTQFHTNFPSGVEEGERKLRTTVITAKHAVTGRRAFSDFVSTDPEQRRIREIEEEIRRVVARDASGQYGIEVVDFGLKKLALPQQVTSAVFESMRENEKAKAVRYTAEGEATASQILAEARAMEKRILSEAERRASEIETEAERIVSEYYKEFSQYPDLRIFLDKLRTLAEALKTRTTLILTDRESPWDLFDETARRAVPGPIEPSTLGGSVSGPAAPPPTDKTD
jgi:membrane protease subunit HflC